ncbi:MAG: adenylyl-sulfate kinase [Bacteroidales bacterium]|nr:adenylyl-sulfate kinase [Bacteroidales bacterium]
MHASEIVRQKLPWIPEEISDPNSIPTGDMPGDNVRIVPEHIRNAQIIFPILLEMLIPVLEENPYQRSVVSVCGGSGAGKSGIASVVSYYLNQMSLGSYTLSGDNYPHRLPKYNDAERLNIFRKCGIDGLIANGQYLEERQTILKEIQENGNDSNPEYICRYPWLSVYQSAGRNGLKNYLGTPNEIDFQELTGVISRFKNGDFRIMLKRMGREETELWYELVDFSDKNILIIEWTHGNSHNIKGVDIPILLNSTPRETLESRKLRNRDGATDSPFTTMVLEIEQDKLISQAPNAKLIVSRSGKILAYKDFVKLMIQEQI